MGAPAGTKIRDGLELPENIREWFEKGGHSGQVPPVWVREWLARILQRHYRLFYGIAFGYFRNPAHAEDVIQSASLKALQNVGSLKRPESVVDWLARITRNACVDALRDRHYRSSEPIELIENLPAPGSSSLHRLDRQRILLREINALPENQAIVVRLRFLEDCDIEEIAERLGLKRNAVEVRLHRALKALAKSRHLREFYGRTA
jgi:RNA polymerase sigma-70 factor (ECF subfamily)